MTTITVLPNAAGSVTGLSKWPNTGSNYEKVNDSDNGTYVYTYSTSVVRDTYNFANLSDLGIIASVSVSVIAAVYTGTGYATPILRLGSTNYGSEQSIGSSYATKSQTWTTNPATGMAWSWSDLDSAEIGVGLRTDDPAKNANCAKVSIKVEYATRSSGGAQIIGLGL